MLREAEVLPAGPGSVAAFEYAIAVADAHRDEALGFEARTAAFWPLYRARRADTLAVVYAWCLAYLDRHPSSDSRDTLWIYRIVVDLLPRFSAVPRGQLEATWQDMFDRYRAAGRSARSPWTQRRRLAHDLGDADLAAHAAAEYPRCGRDDLSDPTTTERVFDVQHAAFCRDDAATVALAERILGGASGDGYTDGYSLVHAAAAVLPALVRLGRAADGRRLLDRAARVVRRQPEFLSGADAHVVFLTVTGDPEAAVAHFNRNFTPAATRAGDVGELPWLRAALLLTRDLVRHGRRFLLHVPAGFVPAAPGRRCSAGELRDWLEAELPRLSRLADARNGTSYQTDRLAELAG